MPMRPDAENALRETGFAMAWHTDACMGRGATAPANRKRARPVMFLFTGFALLALQGCLGSDLKKAGENQADVAHINNETKFSSAEYGVEGSPRVTTVKRPPKGGGRYQVGKPYTIRGLTYYPRKDPNLDETGMASWYGPNFHGRLTANGEIYDQYSLSAAHPTMPLPSYARVTNLENGRAVTVRVNDRGPFAKGRVIDLSARAAQLLGYDRQGLARVRVQYAGEAPLHGLDEQFLVASYSGPGTPRGMPGIDAPTPGGTMIALADPAPVSAGPVTRPAAAIDAAAGPAGGLDVIDAARIPLPEERPTLFEGVPMIVAGEPLYRALPLPMAFAQGEQPLGYEEHAAIMRTQFPYLGEAPLEPVIIDLGRFVEGTGVEEIQARLSQTGGRVSAAGQGRFQLETVEANANAVLDWLRSQGLDSATIR